MIALWIFLGIIGLIAVLLILPLRLNLRYQREEGLTYYAKFLFFRFEPSETPNERLTQQVFSILGLSDVQNVTNAKRAVNAKGVSTTFRELTSVLKTLLGRIFWLLHHGSFRKFELQIIVGDEDAAEAAFGYGLICAAVYPMVGLLETVIPFRRRTVDIRCDYDQEETHIDFFAQFQIRLWYVLRAFLHIIRKNITQTLEKEGRNP